MKKPLLRLGALLALGLSAWTASATTAVTVSSVNLRAGPAMQYPVVTVMPTSVNLTSYGCLADMSWCDVSWNGQRGWVSSSYIRVIYQQQPVMVTAATAVTIGVTVAVFNQAYWDHHYHGRPWYGNWSHYYRYAPPVVHRGATACNGNGCAHVGKTYVPGAPPVVHRGATSCSDGRCNHVGTTVRPAPAPVVRRPVIIHD
ncbi:Uncharacterized conserved protein YraI [Pseudoxanthomonas sp. GM95]|uniref:SH3 domain-containing protein n=1 Tax=Pseudoxanthomonas sp. GM95 TaxID=1881043 RepID=UPI0008D459B0|nr:SH3 domain-containing protein [Pseudoxanthomonas sp. GM95]SEL08623.1 Uncharacterized conserved protein YraI [Pseudoxanthomonas sp. GM95]